MRLPSFFISKKTILLHFLFFIISPAIFAQSDSSFFKKPDTRYYSVRYGRWWAESPMIGFGIVYFQFNYGYTIFANKKFKELSPHSFSLSWHHQILPKSKK